MVSCRRFAFVYIIKTELSICSSTDEIHRGFISIWICPVWKINRDGEQHTVLLNITRISHHVCCQESSILPLNVIQTKLKSWFSQRKNYANPFLISLDTEYQSIKHDWQGCDDMCPISPWLTPGVSCLRRGVSHVLVFSQQVNYITFEPLREG